jgi:predicted DNA-binding protein (MmcQ/YjbR family)
MNVEEVRQICLAKKGVTEGFPFDETTLVIKVGGKIYALISLDRVPSVNLKCDPERAIDLRERYHDITPGYHMNKKHWNTVMLEGDLQDHLIVEMIGHSYDLVLVSLPRKVQEEVLGIPSKGKRG